jgi:hypothetical protein
MATEDETPEPGEHWWPVALAIVVTVALHVAMPAKYRVNPPWVVPAVLLALLAAMIVGDPGAHRPLSPTSPIATTFHFGISAPLPSHLDAAIVRRPRCRGITQIGRSWLDRRRARRCGAPAPRRPTARRRP